MVVSHVRLLMSRLDDARYAFSKLLEELALEYATDSAAARYVIPTSAGMAIAAEFVELESEAEAEACVVLVLPLLRRVSSDITTEAATAVFAEGNSMLLGKLVVDLDYGVVEVRHELIVSSLSARTLGMVLGALSTHSLVAERLELLLGGELGPSYDEMLDGE